MALNLAIDKEAIAEQIFGGFAAIDEGQLLSPSILGYNDSLEAVRRTTPTRPSSLIDDAGVAGETITLVGESSGRWLNDRDLLEAVAGYWTAAGLEVDLRRPSSAPTSTSCSTATTGPTPSSCRARTTSSTPTVSCRTYYQAGGIGSSNTDAELSALIDEGRSELDPDGSGRDLRGGRQDRLRRGLLRLARQQPGPLRPVASG